LDKDYLMYLILVMIMLLMSPNLLRRCLSYIQMILMLELNLYFKCTILIKTEQLLN